MIRLSSVLQIKAVAISSVRSSATWQGRSVQNISMTSARNFCSDKDKKQEPLPAHLLPPPGRPIEVPNYLKKGHPYEISIRSGPIRNDDQRTEEERDKEFWDSMRPSLTAEQAAKLYPDSPYFKKEKKDK